MGCVKSLKIQKKKKDREDGGHACVGIVKYVHVHMSDEQVMVDDADRASGIEIESWGGRSGRRADKI